MILDLVNKQKYVNQWKARKVSCQWKKLVALATPGGHNLQALNYISNYKEIRTEGWNNFICFLIEGVYWILKYFIVVYSTPPHPPCLSAIMNRV